MPNMFTAALGICITLQRQQQKYWKLLTRVRLSKHRITHCTLTSTLSISVKFFKAFCTFCVLLVTVSIMLCSTAYLRSPTTGCIVCQTINTQFTHLNEKRNVREYLRHFWSKQIFTSTITSVSHCCLVTSKCNPTVNTEYHRCCIKQHYMNLLLTFYAAKCRCIMQILSYIVSLLSTFYSTYSNLASHFCVIKPVTEIY